MLIRILIIYILSIHLIFANEDSDKMRLLFEMSLEELMDVKVESASTYLEKESEAPAVINVINQNEMKRYGFRNLFDILSYEPGAYIAQDSNEQLYVQRGVFGSTTQKTLFMRDGYRMNNTLFNSVAIDNSISMQSLNSVEVLRGSAGSIYGDMALTGVVSLNSLPSYLEDGTYAGVTLGSFGTHGADITYKGGNLLTWAHYFDIEGEDVYVNSQNDYATNAISARQTINKIPDNFDIGLKYESEFYKFVASQTKNKRIPERSANGQLLELADLAPFEVYQDIEQTSVGFTVKPIYKNFVFELNHFFQRFKIAAPQVISAGRDGNYVGLNLNALNYSYGLDYRAKYYQGKHTFLSGFKIEADRFDSLHNTLTVSTASNSYDMPSDTELKYSIFLQDKYKYSDKIIVNLGFRYDYFDQVGGELSPRLAFNYYLNERSVIKAIYSHAFLSPLYFYRNANPALGYGATGDLEPEKSDNFQLVYQTLLGSSTNARVTIFRTEYEDLVVRNGAKYVNLGSLKVGGVEAELKYHGDDRLEWFLNYSYLRVISQSSDVTNVQGNDIKGYPTSMLKGGVSYLIHKDYNLYISPTVQFISSVTNQNLATNSGYTVANINFYSRLNKNLELSMGIYNITDADYEVGGSVNPYPQNGRNVLAKIGYFF